MRLLKYRPPHRSPPAAASPCTSGAPFASATSEEPAAEAVSTTTSREDAREESIDKVGVSRHVSETGSKRARSVSHTDAADWNDEVLRERVELMLE